MTFQELAFRSERGRGWALSDVPENMLTNSGRRVKEQTGRPSYYRTTQRGLSIGENALASGDMTVACGPFAYAAEFESVAGGAYARAEGRQSTAFGNRSRATGTRSTHIGQGGTTTSIDGTTVGQGSMNTGTRSTVVGQGAKATEVDCTVVGQGAIGSDLSATVIGKEAACSGAFSTVVGETAEATGGFSVVIGVAARSSAANGIVIGYASHVQHSYSTVIGVGSHSSADNQFVAAGIGPSDYNAYFGNGPQSGEPISATVQATGANGTDVAAGHIRLAGGQGTGTGAGGEVMVQTATPGATSSSLNALATVARWIDDGHFVVVERTTNPATADLATMGEVSMYMKANKLVFGYNNAGTMTYLSIPLDGATTTWTHSTAAP